MLTARRDERTLEWLSTAVKNLEEEGSFDQMKWPPILPSEEFGKIHEKDLKEDLGAESDSEYLKKDWKEWQRIGKQTELDRETE